MESWSLMRRLTAATLAVLAVLLIVAAAPACAFDSSAAEATVLRLINEARSGRGLAKVKIVSRLDRAALRHSRDMITRDHFSHSSRVAASSDGCVRCASRWSVGEVIALGSGSKGSPESVFKGWMRSGEHRSVMLMKGWRGVGIGCARGTYKGVPGVVVYTVQFRRRIR